MYVFSFAYASWIILLYFLTRFLSVQKHSQFSVCDNVSFSCILKRQILGGPVKYIEMCALTKFLGLLIPTKHWILMQNKEKRKKDGDEKEIYLNKKSNNNETNQHWI